MRKFKLLTALLLVIGLSIALCSCGNASPLAKAYKDLEKVAEDDMHLSLYYDTDQDQLQIGIYNGADLEPVFEALNRNIEGQDIGGIYFRTHYNVDNTILEDFDKRIGEISCNSIDLLGVDTTIAELKTHKWLNAASKADKIFVPSLWVLNQYNDQLKDVRKVWVEDTNLGSLKALPNLEELSICAYTDQMDWKHTSVSSEGLPSVTEEPQEEMNQEEAAGQQQETAQNQSTQEADTEAVFLFDQGYGSVDQYLPLKKAKNLKRLIIAPRESKYTLNTNGCGYLYAVKCVRPDLEVNPPNEEFTGDNFVSIADVDLSKMDDNPFLQSNITEEFLRAEVKSAYNKGIKYKKKTKSPVVVGKALIYKAEPDTTGWSDKRKYHSQGELIKSSDIKGAIKTPDAPGDYDTFIYIYPIYKYYGKYTSGTKAYTVTYMAQVFDRKNKIRYAAQEIASKSPPQKFSYYGSAPAKHSATIGDKKIKKYLKNLKTKK